MDLAKDRSFTIEDIYSLKDGQRAELIDGQLFMMAPPNRRHQEIVFSLSRKIADYVEKKGGKCKVYLAPFAVFLNKDNKNYVEPDISVICNPDLLDERGCNGAPDWIVEVVSPGSQRMDYAIKSFKYRTAGVREYWIVDQEKNRITVWNFENHEDEKLEEFSFVDTVQSGIYEDLEIDFSGI